MNKLILPKSTYEEVIEEINNLGDVQSITDWAIIIQRHNWIIRDFCNEHNKRNLDITFELFKVKGYNIDE